MAPLEPADLLLDDAFARRIAIGLLHDRERADDLVQEAWLEILEKRPPGISNPRGYLRLLLRRLSFRKRREESRRKERERASIRSTAVGETAALVARAEIHRFTVTAVLALDEPYRSTILLRFYEDLTPAEIAARSGIPVETARTRLKRALLMLRARLEDEGRDWREEWAVALTGASGWPSLHATSPEPVLQKLAPWAVATGLGGLVLVAWLARAESAARYGAVDPAAPEVVRAEAHDSTPKLAPSPGERVAVGATSQPEAPSPAARLTARILDEYGQPLADARVQVTLSGFQRRELALATTDASGSVSCSLAGWYALSPVARSLLGIGVEAWKGGHEPVSQEVAFTADGRPGDLELVLPRGRLLTGRVLVPDEERSDFTYVTARTTKRNRSSSPHDLTTEAGSDGWFAFGLEEGERVLEARAYCAMHGIASWSEGSFSASIEGDIALPPLPLSPGNVLRGRCVHPDGTPVRRFPLRLKQVEPDAAGGYRAVEQKPSDCRWSVEDVTDELGRFLFAGLCPGLFQVFDGDVALGDGFAWKPDGSELELVIARRRLQVTVIDPAGGPLGEARLVFTRLSGEKAGTVLRAITKGSSHSTNAASPRAALSVAPGETISALVSVPGCVVVEERFLVPANAYASELRLELAPEARDATLVLQPNRGPLHGWRVDLCAPLSGVPIPGWQDLAAGTDGRVVALPLGSYRLRIEPTEPGPDDASPQWCALGMTEPVTLVEGETRFAFETQRAARLRVLFTGATPAGEPRPIEDLEAKYSAGTERIDWLNLTMLPARGQLELWPLAPGASEPWRRVRDMKPAPDRFLELVVPAAPTRLRVALPGRDPFERELFPLPGEALEIPIPLTQSLPAR